MPGFFCSLQVSYTISKCVTASALLSAAEFFYTKRIKSKTTILEASKPNLLLSAAAFFYTKRIKSKTQPQAGTF